MKFIIKYSGILLIIFLSFNSYAQLIINEVSQGPSGSKEYVEFLITGTASCSPACVDLRGWIIDDNNGWHAQGVGVGIAQGCVRFSNNSFWSCIKVGTMIVLYNDSDPNALLPANDLTDANNDCVYIIPISNTSLFQRYMTSPSSTAGDSLYKPNTWTWTNGGSWTPLSMANSDDSYHTVAPNDTLNPYFAVSWANNTKRNKIYFTGDATGKVMFMANTTNNNPFTQSNWTNAPVAGNETPGAANNAANSTWIKSLNNNCKPALSVTLTSTNLSCNGVNTGSANVVATGGTTPLTYTWSNGAATQTISSLAAGTYTATVKDANNCSTTKSVVITQPDLMVMALSKTNAVCNCPCPGKAFVTNITGGTRPYTFLWSTGATTLVITDLCPGTYSVVATDANGCTVSGSVTVP